MKHSLALILILSSITFCENHNFFNEIIFKKIIEENKNDNILISPFSLKIALLMVYQGSEKETKKEIEKIFSIENQNQINKEIKKVLDSYRNESEVFSVANSIWVHHTFKILKNFNENIRVFFNSDVFFTDFTKVKEACDKINTWVSEKTNKMIDEIADENSVDVLTRLVILNAIYFKDNWKYEFKKEDTYKDNFYDYKSQALEAEFMSIKENFKYYQDDNLEMIEIPYQNEKFKFLGILPKNTDIYQFVEQVNLSDLKKKIALLAPEKINLHIPKFEVENDFELKKTLEAIGFKYTINNPDFSKINQNNELYINSVIHKTKIILDEKGTEAAAATAIFMRVKSAAPSEELLLKFNKPFMYMIYDKSNNNIMFWGIKIK